MKLTMDGRRDVPVLQPDDIAALDDLILDVRTEPDFEEVHLAGAYNVPWEEMPQRGFELPPRSKPMLVTCSLGSVRNLSPSSSKSCP